MEGKKKKLLTTGLAVALAALLLIGGGTFAYLQGTSQSVKNTFETNKVDVTLTETEGENLGYNYNIIPGTTQPKNPKVIVDNTVDAYVFVEVTDNTYGLVTYEIAEGWNLLGGYENVYYREVAKDAGVKEFSVLKDDKVIYSAALENKDMLNEEGKLKDGIELTFKALAKQKEGFYTAADAYLGIPISNVATQDEFKDALESINAGGTIVLTNNVAVVTSGEGESLVSQMSVSKDMTLDLSGQELSVDSSVYNKNLSYTPALLEVVDGATLTINGNGTINAEAGYNNSYGIDVNGGNLIINGGNYYGALTAIQVTQGSLVINDGFFDLARTCKAAVPAYAKYVVNCIDRNYKDGTAKISIKGGTFVNFDPSDSPEGAGTSYVAEGYKVVSETRTDGETWYTVVPK